MKKLALFGVGLLLAGCASVGTDYDVNALSQLKPGMSQTEVIGMLGKPNTQARLPDGKTVLVWSHSKAKAFGSVNARSVSLQFDADGKLVDSRYQTQFETN